MKNTFLLILIALIARTANSQPGDSLKATEPFSTIQIYDGIEITLERGEGYYLSLGPNTELENLSISLENGTLKIRKIPGNKYPKPPALKIIFKELKVIEGFSKANIDAKNLIKGDSVKVVLKSGATLYAGFDIKYLEVNIIEGCLFKADGYATIQKIDVATKATFAGFELEGVEAEVKTSTGGKAKVNVEKKLTATASSGGFISYRGNPATFEKTSLGGKIIRDTDQ
jgi:hypothetical protein